MKKMNLEFPWWITLILVIAIIGVSKVLDLVLGKFSINNILWSTAVLIVVVILSSIVGAIVTKRTEIPLINKIVDEHQKQIKYLEDKTETNSRISKSIISVDKLIELESSVKTGGEIWILTSALELDDNVLKGVIHSNIRKKIKYKYLIPDDNTILKKKMARIAKEWKYDCGLSIDDANEQIKCYLVPKHFVYMTIAIYDVWSPKPTVIVKFPTSKINGKEKYPIYKVDPESKDTWESEIFLKSIQDLLDDDNPVCQLVRPLPIDFS